MKFFLPVQDAKIAEESYQAHELKHDGCRCKSIPNETR
jgi:hypothetical protein